MIKFVLTAILACAFAFTSVPTADACPCSKSKSAQKSKKVKKTKPTVKRLKKAKPKA